MAARGRRDRPLIKALSISAREGWWQTEQRPGRGPEVGESGFGMWDTPWGLMS